MTSFPNSVPLVKAQKKDATFGSSSIFQRFLCVGETQLSHGERVTLPWHCWAISGLTMWGSADVKYVQKLIKGPWLPVLASDGRAHMCVMLVKYHETSLEPYTEFVVSFSVVHESRRDLAKERMTTFDVIGLLKDHIVQPYVYKLWLASSGTPIDYGCELHGLDKYHTQDGVLNFREHWLSAEAEFNLSHVSGEVNDPPIETLLKGKLTLQNNWCGGNAICGSLRSFGLRETLSLLSGADGSWAAVSPPGIMKGGDEWKTNNPISEFAYEANFRFTTASASDDLQFGGELKAMGFKPLLYMYDPNMKAVLLLPSSAASPSTMRQGSSFDGLE